MVDRVYGNRHPSVQEKMRWLIPNPNLPEHLRVVAEQFWELGKNLLAAVTVDTPQLALALQHLIDAKDCAVRARLAADD